MVVVDESENFPAMTSGIPTVTSIPPVVEMPDVWEKVDVVYNVFVTE